MARPWKSALHFEPTINCLTLHLVYPKDFAPGGRAVSRLDVAIALTLQLFPTTVAAVAPVLELCLVQVVVVAPVLQLCLA